MPSSRRKWVLSAAIGSAVLVLSTAASPQGTGTPPTADRPGARDDIEVLAPRDLTIDARHAGSTTSKLRIPIRTRPADRLERLAFQTIGVSLGGRPLEPSAVQLAVERAAPQPWLVVTIDLAMAAESGTYTVKALASSPDLQDPPPVLELTFTRPAAELRVANSLRVERVVYLPGLSVTRPDSVIFSETKGKSAVLPEPSTWISDLVRDGQLVPGRMEVKLPTSIDAGAQGAATLAIRGDVPLGKSTGSVTVRAPQLAAGVYEASVDVVGRVSRIWLVAAVVGGIGLGYYTRTSLEDRRKRLQARIAASERLNRIDDQIGREIDDDVIGELTRVRAGLLTALRSGDPAPEAIDIATKAADDGLTNALRKADERRAALRAGIADLSAQLGSPENLPDPIRPIVEHALAGLKAAGARLNAGVIAPVEEELADLRRTLPDRLRAALTDWKGSIDLALNRMGDWPETLFARASAELASRWKDPNGLKLETLKDYLEMAATQGLGIRSSLLDVGLASILDLAAEVFTILDGLGDQSLVAALDALKGAHDSLEAQLAPGKAPTLEAVSGPVHELRRALSAAIRGAAPAAPPGLDEGKFLQAARNVQTSRAVGGRSAAPRVADAGPGDLGPIAAPDVSDWTVLVVPPIAPTVGQPIALNAVVKATPGHSAPRVTLSWILDGQVQKRGEVDDLVFYYVPRRAGTQQVRIEAQAASGGPPRSTTLSLNIREPGAPELPVLVGDIRKTERIQTLISGLLIAATGVILLKGIFIGTAEDFLTAILWGFTVDIGVARVREVGSPLLARTTAGTARP